MDTENDPSARQTIIPHETSDADCCGCLMVVQRGDQADVVCNECGALIRTVRINDVEHTLSELASVKAACSVACFMTLSQIKVEAAKGPRGSHRTHWQADQEAAEHYRSLNGLLQKYLKINNTTIL